MLKKISFLILCVIIYSSCKHEMSEQSIHIAFVVGDEEYRSEESMPMLAAILKRELGAQISFCMSIDSSGFIDPNRTEYIDNLEVLDSADIMVMFTRFRNIPNQQVEHIRNFAESGKPIVGFRTSTHAFLYKDSSMIEMNNEWPTKLFGQQWITHHGHFDDGDTPLTHVSIYDQEKANPILNGVKPFDAYSWLYHVDGGDWKLFGDPNLLLSGKSLRSNHEGKGNLEKFPMTNPVAWTKSYSSESGLSSRVFFTTLGHPYDFKIESMRKLSLNGIYWALGFESRIPTKGVNAKYVKTYEPNNSGFGEKFKKGQQVPKI